MREAPKKNFLLFFYGATHFDLRGSSAQLIWSYAKCVLCATNMKTRSFCNQAWACIKLSFFKTEVGPEAWGSKHGARIQRKRIAAGSGRNLRTFIENPYGFLRCGSQKVEFAQFGGWSQKPPKRRFPIKMFEINWFSLLLKDCLAQKLRFCHSIYTIEKIRLHRGFGAPPPYYIQGEASASPWM